MSFYTALVDGFAPFHRASKAGINKTYETQSQKSRIHKTHCKEEHRMGGPLIHKQPPQVTSKINKKKAK